MMVMKSFVSINNGLAIIYKKIKFNKSQKKNILDIEIKYFKGIDSVIHLANIANDPAVDLNPTLSWEVNVLAGYQLIDKAVRARVKQFIYASSGSVYGIKEERVTENLELVPISTYNKTKMCAESDIFIF